MIDEIARIVIGFQLVPVVFPGNGKHEITYHRETYDEEHIAEVLQKENCEDAIKNKRELDPEVQAAYIDKTRKYGIKYKIAKQRRIVFIE
jgi:hypothetical protein